MASKRDYSRYFIILQEDEKGYSIDSNRFPTGYAKIEKKSNKCKVSYYVQNLKKDKEPYYMVLICSKKSEKKLIKLGEMNIDEYGRTEISYEYQINNIANIGISVDKIKGACVVKVKESTVHSVLVGFVSGVKIDNWAKYPLIEGKQQRNTDENEEVDEKKESIVNTSKLKVEKDEEVKNRENIKSKVRDDIKIQKDYNIENNNIVKDKETKIEEIKNKDDIKNKTRESETNNSKNVKNSNNNDVKNSNDNDVKNSNDNDVNGKKEENRIFEEYEKNIEEIKNINNEAESLDNTNHILEDDTFVSDTDNESYNRSVDYTPINRNYPTGTEGKFFKKIAEGLEEVEDICPEVGSCKWYKVHLRDLQNMNCVSDKNKYTIIYYPMACYYPYIMRHGHYIVGYKYDTDGKMKYLVYGVPGTKSIEDQPFRGMTGFVTWACAEEEDDEKNSLGYWLMFYDFKNSRIMIPIKKN
ncbi:hypothetical protein OW763_11260 [Clostridium aestuarii]|uniref:Transmembrane protein n=1 Tax=Clostridium aestuarii TaxID=338193 RepID=A0ABT4D0Z7_9CLOT|nr:hypothetical protein [Clostridium aestuarii]MCY6484920.1 hypothetical protein [Clostridium aestuarii]